MPSKIPTIRLIFIPLHILAAFALFCGCTKELGAFCSEKRVIPLVFLAPPCLLVLALLIHMNLYALDFLIEWKAPDDLTARKKFGSLERTIKVQRVFLSQTRRMYCQLAWTTALATVLIAAGFIYVAKTRKLTCGPDGLAWMFKDMRLSMWFYASILIVALMNSAVLRVVFVKTDNTPSCWSWVKGYFIGDLVVHFTAGDRFESDDSDFEDHIV